MKDKKLKIIGLIMGFLISILMSGLYVFDILRGLENKALDWRFVMRGERPVEIKNAEGEDVENVIIIGVDEPSTEKYGRWPWPRDLHAQMVDVLTRAGAKVIVFDVILSEPDNMNPAGDWKLAFATKSSGKVIHAHFFEKREVNIIDQDGNADHIIEVINHKPIPTLNDAAWKVGFVDAFPDTDGGLRKSAIRQVYEGKNYYPIDVMAVSLYSGREPEEILAKIPRSALYAVQEIDTGMERTMIMANYYGPQDSFPSYSYHQLLNEKIPMMFKKNWVQDKIVLIGSKIVGAFDHYPMAFDQVYPGVEFHATVINNLIEGNFISRIPRVIVLVLIILGGLICGIALPRYSPWIGTIVVFGLAFIYLFGTQYLFVHNLLYIPLVAPLLTLITSYVTILFYRFVTEEKEKRRIKRSFGQYVSRAVLDEILSNPNMAKLGGERRHMTILFSDIRGFTTLSEGMTPEAVVDLLNEYLTKMTDVVYKYGGTLDKFIGDAVMAFWGAPIPQEDHPQRAALCAVGMMEELTLLQAKWIKEGRSSIDIGIGVNTGDAVVGNMGSEERMDYTVIGDNVNLASRLEGLNKVYHSHIIISEETKKGLQGNTVETFPLGSVKVKGKAQAVPIYQVIGPQIGSKAIWHDKKSDTADTTGTREFKTK